MICAEHEWIRFPVVDRSVDYGCGACGLMRSMAYNPTMAGKPMVDIDRKYELYAGGRVVSFIGEHGEVVPL